MNKNIENIADWVAYKFVLEGIDRVFVYPGGTIAPLINACIKFNIKIECLNNEQGSGYAALAYSRINHRPQVVMVTSGPGVTNVISPLADAYYDSSPLIVITGQIGTGDLTNRLEVRQRGFQETFYHKGGGVGQTPDYWGNDLPFRKGTLNFDKISLEYFGDSTVLFEAFKAGEIDIFREGNAEKWETQFNFPNAINGKIIKSEIPHGRPTGMRGLVMNSRKEVFSDWRVRQALIEAFNFEYINEAQNAGRQQRITSYFSNSILGMRKGAAKNSVLELSLIHI